jgi:hypothetical protein
MGKQLVNFITCGCECTLFVNYKAGREPKPYVDIFELIILTLHEIFQAGSYKKPTINPV